MASGTQANRSTPRPQHWHGRPSIAPDPADSVLPAIPDGWPVLELEREQAYFRQLEAVLRDEYRRGPVYPRADQVFEALRLTPLHAVRAVLVGQDPYHQPGQAHGLAFSVPPGIRPPPSLRNLFRELQHDLGLKAPDHGCLESWARQGVLLLNTVLTVRAGEPGSHSGIGWERFTDAVIQGLNARPRRAVFLLLGANARKKRAWIDTPRHALIEAPHPSPLSARRGFLGSRIFSRTNRLLEESGQEPIDWTI